MKEGKSIQTKLLLGFISSTIFVLAVVGFSIVFLNKAERVRSVKDQIIDLNTRLFNLRDIENQFYEFNNLSQDFFNSGSDLITIEYEDEFDELRSGLNALIQSKELGEIKREQLTSIDSMLLQYNLLFNSLKEQVQFRGFKNYGLEGKMRRYAHDLEDENNAINSVSLLMLRRHEKDFFLRGESEYLDKFNLLSNEITEDLENQNALEDLNRLQLYAESFNRVVTAEMKIGTAPNRGIRGNLKSLSDKISQEFSMFNSSAQQDISKRISSIENFYFASIGLSLLFSLLLAFYLSNALAKPLREIALRIRKFDFNDVKNRNKIETDTTTEEFIILSNSFNSLISLLAEQISLVDAKGKEIHEQNRKLHKIADELKASNNVKDKFFSIISHDLKGPIANMGVYLEALAEDTDTFTKEELKIFASKLLGSVNHLNELMENLLEWSRSQTGVIQFRPESIDLKKLIVFNKELGDSRASLKDIEIEVEVPKGLKAFADKNMVDFILRNLISNAVKFTPRNGKIWVKAIVNNGHIEISVKDNGIGIPGESKSKVFKSTEHISTYGTADEKGTGLGLMLCKDFVERNRGEIWLNSEVGKGTRVTFSLPTNH